MAIAAYLDKKDKSEGAYGYEKQDPDIKGKKGTQPAKYHKGLSKSTKQKRDAHFTAKKKGPAPGDATGKTKPSVHTKKFKQMFGEEPRIPRKKGQPAGSDKHSDLYTDENPVGTIHGLGFKDVKTAKASVKKIIGSGKTHAHKIQAAIAMEQRAKEMGKTAEAAVYRKYIEKMKQKTKEMQKEDIDITGLRTQLVKKMFSKQKHDVYHSNFSSMIQHIADMAKKLYGITIDPKTVTDTAKNKNKPKAGVTKKFSLKGDKGSIKAFIYNRGGLDNPFELRMYQEDLETNEELDESLWANIHKKRQRIKRGSGEKMRKKGEKGAPTPAQMKRAKGEDIGEKAPDTSDAMKRYKAGKAGFTDKAHLKAKGLIPRADGTKKKSPKYENIWYEYEDVCCEECETESRIIKENMYRVGSEAYFQYFVDLREKFENGEVYYRGFDQRLLEGDIGKFAMYEGEHVPLDCPMMEAEYDGREVELNKPKAGGPKKYYVYVKDPSTGNVKKVTWGDTTGLKIKLDDKAARKSFAARHKCDQQKDKTTASYWACNIPRYADQLGLSGGGNFFW